ncbi:TRAP transporter small permease [Billgrantia antri]|uniref:TRAP transporter small permease protein n=1 Tax=Halomonas sulfidivorans TaxID=2733488 RepID=A0ABX7WFT7_9GAMM|nr:TRAP transporter small permease [Halomonas sulfidivorans]QTP58367.1 TRAP transporter small permease [Halomonas sulfidivorans]
MDSPEGQSQAEAPDSRQVPSLDAMSEVPKLGGAIGRVIGWIDTLFIVLANLALVAIAATVMLQISGRLFLPYSPAWTEELSRYLFIYMVALSSGVAIRRNRHVNVELFHHRLGLQARAGYQALISLMIGAFAGILLPYAWLYAQNGAWQTSPTLKVPMLYIFFSTVVLYALVLFYSVVGVIEGLMAMQRKPETGSWK